MQIIWNRINPTVLEELEKNLNHHNYDKLYCENFILFGELMSDRHSAEILITIPKYQNRRVIPESKAWRVIVVGIVIQRYYCSICSWESVVNSIQFNWIRWFDSLLFIGLLVQNNVPPRYWFQFHQQFGNKCRT